MARNNGLSLVAKLNISLSEAQISEDLKKISEYLDERNLPSFIAHININGSAAAMNRELQALGKKLKVDFGQITNNNKQLKNAGKKVAKQVYNVQELKAAGQDYIYNANNIQKQIDQLQSRYDKRSISLQNSVNVSAVTNEIGQVKALRVEYENLEHQMVRVDYIKAKFDNKKTGFVSTGAVYSDKTEGKAYQETLSYMSKIESSFRRIHDSATGFSSPIKEGTKFFDQYNAKAESVAKTITEIRSNNKILSDEQRTYISSLVSSFEAYTKNLKEAAKGASSLSPKNLSESIKQSNAELDTMLKNLSKNRQETGFLGIEYKKIYKDVSELRTQLNSVTNGEEFALYSANLKLVRESVKQYNSDVSNSTAHQKLKSDMDDINAKIMTFIRENKNLTDSYKQNLLDLAGQANRAKSGFELKGITGQANAYMNAYTKSEDLRRSILTLNNSLTVSEQRLLEMRNDTSGLDVEFERVAEEANRVRTALGSVDSQDGLKNIKIEVTQAKQAINDLYRTWQSRQIDNQKMVTNQTLNSMSERLLAQRNDLYGFDQEYENFTNRIVDIQNRLAQTNNKVGFNRISAEVSTLNSQLNNFYNQINAMQRTTLFNEGIETQLNKIDANARSVSSHLARDNQLMAAYEAELTNVRSQIDNITNGTEILSQTQQTEIRRIIENFRLYEAELQNVAKENLKPTLMQDMSVYSAEITSMISKLDAMATKVPETMTAQVGAFRTSLEQLRTQVGNVTQESDLTNISVNFKLAREEFSQLTSAISGDNSLDNLINKIATLDTEMGSYLRTTTNITQVQRNTINDFRDQLATAFTMPDFERIRTEYSNFVKSIATEQQRIGGIPLEDKLLHVQEVLVTLRTSVIAHREEVGSLGTGYNQLITEIDNFIAGINNGAITSKDDFEMMENSIGQLQERIKQTGIEIKTDLNFLSVNNSVRTLVSDINAYLANNLNLPERFRLQAEAIVYELNHTTDKITFDDLKVRWRELVNTINSEVIKVGGVEIADKVNTGIEALNVLRQTLVAQKGDVGSLDGVYRGLLADIDNLKLAAQNIYSPDQYNAWANDTANLQRRVEQLKNSIKSSTEINQLAVQASNLSSKINLFISQNSKLSETAKQKLRELAAQAEQAQSKMQLSNINTQFSTFVNKLKQADKLGTSIIDKLKQNISKFSAWFGMTTIIMRTITLMRQMITNVKELDTAMVNLKKVTNETDQSYRNFFERASKSAQELHADMTNLIDATAEFAKLGYSIGEAEELAKSATIYKNVGELDSIEDASSSIVSTMKAFKIEANDAMQIVDKFNKVGNEFSISSAGIGEALRRSASSLAVAGNSIDESIGLITGSNVIIQDPDVVGTALKTMSLRLTTTKAKLEEMGEETEYACETLSEYRNLVLALTANTSKPVDIFGDDGQYKSTTRAMRELASVWHELNSMEQSSIMKALFGVRQANIGASLLENFDVVEAAIESASKASEGIGSAMEEQERWQESLEARINKVNSSLQGLSTDIFKTDDVKDFVSSLNSLVQAIDRVVKIFDVGKIVMGAFAAWVLNTKNIIGATVTETGTKINLFGKQWTVFENSATTANHVLELQASNFNAVTRTLQTYNSQLGQTSILNTRLADSVRIPTTTMQTYLTTLNGAEASLQGYCTWMAQSAAVTGNANTIITRYNSLETFGADAQAVFRAEVARTNPVMAQYLATTNAAARSQADYERYLRNTELRTKATTIATQALNMAMSMFVMSAITAGIQLLSDFANSYDKLLEKSNELRTELDNQINTLSGLRKQYEELLTSTDDEATKNATLAEIKKQLVEQYGFEEEKIRNINELRKEGLGYIDDEIARQRSETIGKTEAVYNKSMKQIDSAMSSYNIGENITINTDNVRKEILDLFDKIDTENGVEFEISADNSIEFLRKLKEIRTELVEVRRDTGNFNSDEQMLFDNLSHILDDVYKDFESTIPLYNLAGNYIASFFPSEEDFKEAETDLKLRAEDVYEAYIKDVGKSFEDVQGTVQYDKWLEGLYQATRDTYGDKYFSYYKTMFKDMFNVLISKANESSDAVNTIPDAFTELEAMILKAKQGLSELDGVVDKEADAFDKLLKVIKNNKDADKFFDQKEIIELLDTYPKLATALEKTEYGYKLNEEALENLKEAMLAEKKEALYTELDKTKVVLDEAKKRLAIYEQEINAREILANSGSAAKKIKSGDFTGLFDLAQANEAAMRYSIAKKNLSDIQATYNKIELQIQELGTEFDDINDSTAETKANASDLKQELSDGLDDLKDAKKYIEDLVELVMQMIRKNKELEKDGLKEKLDNFKKLITRQKELLKLQKEEKKFNDELKDQNKDLLKIKQELDALSVEGVEYSLEDLKRRAELEDQYVEQSKKRDDFLYDHEIETRENALDKEQESFEEQINTQIKAIEDYLDKTGKIRQDAIDLINGKSQEFYNDLMTYTMTYTDKSMHEFTTLWNHAYDALMKYGNGQIDVDMVLALLGNDILATEAKIKSLEASANAASNSTKNGINATREAVELLNRELEEAKKKYQEIGVPTLKVSDLSSPSSLMAANDRYAEAIMKLKGLPKFHDGGIVGGNGEIFAKLMSGEVVSTQRQAETFLSKTLPNLINTGSRISTNTNNSSSFSLGGITINGNADSSTVSQLKDLQKNIGDIIFKIINDQNKIYNGKRVRT